MTAKDNSAKIKYRSNMSGGSGLSLNTRHLQQGQPYFQYLPQPSHCIQSQPQVPLGYLNYSYEHFTRHHSVQYPTKYKHKRKHPPGFHKNEFYSLGYQHDRQMPQGFQPGQLECPPRNANTVTGGLAAQGKETTAADAFSSILESVGSNGRWQWSLCFLCGSCGILFAYQNLGASEYTYI